MAEVLQAYETDRAADRPAPLQPVGNGSQGWTLTQHVMGSGPMPVLHCDDGGELMCSLTTWYSVGP